MTTLAGSPSAPIPTAVAPRRASSTRRVAALARAEMLLLLRNRTTLVIAVGLAPATVGSLAWAMAGTLTDDGGARAVGAFTLTSLVAVALLFVVYYNLTTTFVARREELVLKRLLTGEVTPVEVVVACAVPAVAILLAQLGLGAVAVAVWLDLPPVTHPQWLLSGVVGGVVVFVLLAVASSALTRTVESAQLTTMPVLLVATALSGFTIPLEALPDVVTAIAVWTPMYPVVALLEAGFGGGSGPDLSWSGVGQPLLCLVLWTVNGVWFARSRMRWEPRR
ncbi:ABC transporter permease [Cellulomonas sp. ATA003]|uniref:ABC transporter permease n=1 Tax=Cellulomonas sp. ATA003 TaxID=3073064 RepID=UPI00287381E5|nr:ABC transporter permease [Cellulomonas sp. ATA003]WNB84668.1 ABC transporter permease [Cellulomonas sp. ATA003]